MNAALLALFDCRLSIAGLPGGGNWDTRRVRMSWKRRTSGGVVAFIGFMLSPLSWWNDLFVNVPLAWVFASVVGFFWRPAFGASLVLGYWLTNIIGLIMMHKGGQTMITGKQPRYTRRELMRDVGISVLYTLLIIELIQLGILKPIESYLGATK